MISMVLAIIAAISFIECPKCDRRFRISDDGNSATINLCRLNDDIPNATTLEKRKLIVARRAEEYLKRGKTKTYCDRKCPLMGWASWNTFSVDISEEIILDTARAMATNGLKEAGYLYVNIDDGFFNGHGEDGKLRFHPKRFPNGMKGTVDGIHALGLRAGTYSDAGKDTCGSMWSNDPLGVDAGLYGHDAADCNLHFKELGFDFIKVDYCGGRKLHLDEETRYTEISKAILATGRSDVRFNICRWAFPGTWAAKIADSWRTTEDIRASWKSVRKIIAENLYLGAYASAGHYNDMDMLEVGQRKGAVKSAFGNHGDIGLTEDEEITHFGMWCMLSSPLMIGCDVRTIPSFTMKMITNPYLIAMNQNCGLGVQGQVIKRDGEAYIIAKDADELYGRSRYVALYNAGDTEYEFKICADDLELGGAISSFDLVDKSDIGDFCGNVHVRVPAHGSRFFKMDAEKRVERKVYEAESAYLTAYQELDDKKKTAKPYEDSKASGGVAVCNLGNMAENDLVWNNIRIDKSGRRIFSLFCSAKEITSFKVDIDGRLTARFEVKTDADKFEAYQFELEIGAGIHSMRLYNENGIMPMVDKLVVSELN